MNAELKKRWQAQPAQAFVEKLGRWGRSGNSYEIFESPFEKVAESGRLDFRGMTYPELGELRRITFRNADLSGTVLKRARLELSTFSDVLFDHSVLRSIAEMGNTFDKCSFSRTNFRDAVLGYNGSRFRDCRFEHSDFIQAGFIRPEFDGCCFDTCTFSGVDFQASSFRQCEFRGEVRGVWFRGEYQISSVIEQFANPRPNRMEQVSFKEARLIDVTFSNHCDLSTVIAPENTAHARFDRWLERIKSVYYQSQNWPEPCKKEGENFYFSYETHAQNQDWYLIGMDDLTNRHGKEAGVRIWQALLSSRNSIPQRVENQHD